MPRTISVSIAFDFYPDTDDLEMFDGMTPDQQEWWARQMVCQDLVALSENGDLFKSLTLEAVGEPNE